MAMVLTKTLHRIKSSARPKFCVPFPLHQMFAPSTASVALLPFREANREGAQEDLPDGHLPWWTLAWREGHWPGFQRPPGQDSFQATHCQLLLAARIQDRYVCLFSYVFVCSFVWLICLVCVRVVFGYFGQLGKHAKKSVGKRCCQLSYVSSKMCQIHYTDQQLEVIVKKEEK